MEISGWCVPAKRCNLISHHFHSHPFVLHGSLAHWSAGSNQLSEEEKKKALIIIAKTWKQPSYPSVGEWKYYLMLKGMSYQAMIRHGRILNAYYWQEPIWKDCILYDSNYMTFYKRQNWGDSKKISVCQCLEGETYRQAQMIFNTVKVLRITQHVIIHLSSHRVCNTNSEP